MQCPLTLDYKAIELFIDNMGQNMIPVSGTALAAHFVWLQEPS